MLSNKHQTETNKHKVETKNGKRKKTLTLPPASMVSPLGLPPTSMDWTRWTLIRIFGLRFRTSFGSLFGTTFGYKSIKRHPERHPQINAEQISKNDAKRLPKGDQN